MPYAFSVLVNISLHNQPNILKCISLIKEGEVMQENKEFVDGLFVKAPRAGAPDFVKGAISIKREELIKWLQSREGDWVNLDIKESKTAKWYAQVNDWKPDAEASKKPASYDLKPNKAITTDEIPF